MQCLHPLLPLHPGEQPLLSPRCHMRGTPWGQQTSASSSQPLSNPWPLVWVRQGDSDTYRYVTRATRVPTHPPTHPPGHAGSRRQAGLVPCHHSGVDTRPLPPACHRSKRPPEQAATHASAHLAETGWDTTLLGRWGEEERGCSGLGGLCRRDGAMAGVNEQDGEQPRVETRPLPAVRPRNSSCPPGLQPMPPNKHRWVQRGLECVRVRRSRCRALTPTLDPIWGDRCPVGRPSLALQDYIPHGRQAGSMSGEGTLLIHSLDCWQRNGHPQMLLRTEMPALHHEADGALSRKGPALHLYTPGNPSPRHPAQQLGQPAPAAAVSSRAIGSRHREPSHSSTVCHSSSAALAQLSCRSIWCSPRALCPEQAQVSAPIPSSPADAMKPLPKTPSKTSPPVTLLSPRWLHGPPRQGLEVLAGRQGRDTALP